MNSKELATCVKRLRGIRPVALYFDVNEDLRKPMKLPLERITV